MWFVRAHVVDVLTGERRRDRAVETGPDGTVVQVAAAAPPGLPDAVLAPGGATPPSPPRGAGVGGVAGRWPLPGLISRHPHPSLRVPLRDPDGAENPAGAA